MARITEEFLGSLTRIMRQDEMRAVAGALAEAMEPAGRRWLANRLADLGADSSGYSAKLTPELLWWRGILERGRLLEHHDEWRCWVARGALRDEARTAGLDPDRLGELLSKVCPEVELREREGGGALCWVFPELEQVKSSWNEGPGRASQVPVAKE